MIRAKVAKIIDARTLVLNKGLSDGVEVGMRFAVLNRNGAEIKDPVTGEVLDSVDVEKTVKERVAVARTYRKYGGRDGLSVLGSFAARPAKVETLKTDEATYKEEMSERDSYVKVGDDAVQVAGEEFDTQS
jgi:hypothetical protein